MRLSDGGAAHPEVGRPRRTRLGGFAAAVNADPEMIANASHFLQEDAGEEIGERIAKWIQL